MRPLPHDGGALEYYGNQVVIQMGAIRQKLNHIVTITVNSELHGMTDQFRELVVHGIDG